MKKSQRSQIVPRGTHNDGGRPTAAAVEAEAANDHLLLETRVRSLVVSEDGKGGG